MHQSVGITLIAALLAWVSCNSASTVNVSIPLAPPDNAQYLMPTLVSFSIEQDRWPDWAGVDSTNIFTQNALQNYAELTGRPPKIRVGADSEDHTVWSPTVAVNEDSFPPANNITPFPEATSIVVGDQYYQLSRRLPSGTHMIWGVNLGLDNITNAVNMAKSISKAFASSAVQDAGVVLDRIEIGNEADLYPDNGLRPQNWTVNQYVPDWISLATAVSNAVGLKPNGPVTFQGAAFAGQGFTPTEIFNLGILDSAPGKLISTISQHHYSAAFCNGGNFPLVSFMNKAAVRSNLSIFEADISTTHAKGLDYILGETNSIACHGAPGVSNTAGVALWGIDYTLQAATLGISEAFFHEGVGYKYNFFQPISLNISTIDGTPLPEPQPPHVQPIYYAGIVIDTFIGKTGAAKIVEIAVDNSNVSGYAAFEGGSIVRAVFVNLDAWLASSTGTRPSVHIGLSFNGTTNNRLATATVRRLVIQHADDTAGLSWAGVNFETSDALPTGSTVVEKIMVKDGVDLHATEALLIEF